jgi:hypothetical protein
MISPVIVPIVEGYSEVQSVSVLLRRLVRSSRSPSIKIDRPIRIGRYKIVREGELERAIALARLRACDAIFLLIDADDDCPAELGPALLERAQAVDQRLSYAVVLAKREFEAWLAGGLESLRGIRGIQSNALSPEEPENVRDAKKLLTQQMSGRTYVEVDDQPALTERFDFEAARQRCPSLDKLLRDFDRIASELHSKQ